jgi:hypothetical protein
MLNARLSFALLWKRLVAALSLVMAAALAPTAVPAPAGGAGAMGSRVGSGTAVASAANALAANVASLVEGGQHQLLLGAATGGPDAKACTHAVWQEIAALRSEAVSSPRRIMRAVRQTHAARSGPARAPPAA